MESPKSGKDSIGEDHQFSSPEPTILNFGYGKSACPGRFFASLVLKIMVSKLLNEYDFAFQPGTGRPQNIIVHECLFCWPWQKMLVKQKEGFKVLHGEDSHSDCKLDS